MQTIEVVARHHVQQGVDGVIRHRRMTGIEKIRAVIGRAAVAGLAVVA
jgi:hypothetical protein